MEIINYFFSPFVRPKMKFYFGKIQIGLPYFLPRRKFGFDFCRLGWKTKWNDTDYRFEWPPVFSFVFFGHQLAITVVAREPDHYWESWLFYHYSTDKSKSVGERVNYMILKFPQTYIRHKNAQESKVDCYKTILKKKWRPLDIDEKRDKILDKLV